MEWIFHVKVLAERPFVIERHSISRLNVTNLQPSDLPFGVPQPNQAVLSWAWPRVDVRIVACGDPHNRKLAQVAS